MAKAGTESVTRLIHKICVASRGAATAPPPASRPITEAPTTPRNIVRTSPMFEERRYRRNFRMLAKIARPSRTAATIVAKLSSATIIFADSLATSVPVTPMATPTSAAFRAGGRSPRTSQVCPVGSEELIDDTSEQSGRSVSRADVLERDEAGAPRRMDPRAGRRRRRPGPWGVLGQAQGHVQIRPLRSR
jgi:hypothetical protein